MPQGPVDVTGFFTTMTALSAAVQTLVENVFKKHLPWLDNPKPDKPTDNKRQAAVHLLAFAVGGALAWVTGLHPLQSLGVQGSVISNALAAGVLVSFGGSLLDEAWGAIRAFKKAQEGLKDAGRPQG
jgi:hypothetical protein